jgi:hypothetical protein
MKANHGIETTTGISIFRIYFYYGLAFLVSGAKESLKECRRLHQFRELYALTPCHPGRATLKQRSPILPA